jgi:predicted lactoylglutathione lyase
MAKEIWINLPVKNVARSVAFFTKLGFVFNGDHQTSDSACMLIGEKPTVVMLFDEIVFKGFVNDAIANPSNGASVLFSFDAQSIAEVDAMAVKVEQAGGVLFSTPKDNQGWMYGFGFSDPDGHRWNMLYMDWTKMPKIK